MVKEILAFGSTLAQLHPTIQVAIIMIFIWLVKGGYILNKNRKVKKETTPEPHTGHVSEHNSCTNFPSLILLVKNAINKMAQIQRIQINLTISEQMTEFDDLFVDFKKILKSNYMKLYRKKTKKPVSGILNEKDVQHFIAIVASTEPQLKGLTRRFLKKNHFLEKSEEEFRIYIADRTEDYQNEIGEYLDEHYDSSLFMVSREELYDSHIADCKEALHKKVERFFYKVRTISLEKQKEIKSLESKIEDFV